MVWSLLPHSGCVPAHGCLRSSPPAGPPARMPALPVLQRAATPSGEGPGPRPSARAAPPPPSPLALCCRGRRPLAAETRTPSSRLPCRLLPPPCFSGGRHRARPCRAQVTLGCTHAQPSRSSEDNTPAPLHRRTTQRPRPHSHRMTPPAPAPPRPAQHCPVPPLLLPADSPCSFPGSPVFPRKCTRRNPAGLLPFSHA